MEDKFLIQQILAGNSSAFKFLVHRYRRPVFKFLRGFDLNENEIEELAQEAFLRVYKNLAEYSEDKGASFSTWVFQVAKNLAINELQRSRQRYEVSEDETSREISLNHADPGASQEAMLESLEEQTAIGSAMSQIPVEFKNAVVLSCLNELSLKDIAEIENCSVGTVKSRIFRGKQLLRSLMMRRVEV